MICALEQMLSCTVEQNGHCFSFSMRKTACKCVTKMFLVQGHVLMSMVRRCRDSGSAWQMAEKSSSRLWRSRDTASRICVNVPLGNLPRGDSHYGVSGEDKNSSCPWRYLILDCRACFQEGPTAAADQHRALGWYGLGLQASTAIYAVFTISIMNTICGADQGILICVLYFHFNRRMQ